MSDKKMDFNTMHFDDAVFSESSLECSSDELLEKQPFLELDFSEQSDRSCYFYILSRAKKSIAISLSLIFAALSLVLVFCIFLPRDLTKSCSHKMTGWSPLLDVVGYHDMQLDPTLVSEYTDGLSAKTDQAWNDLWHYGPIAITDDKLSMLNKSHKVDFLRHGDEEPRYTGKIKAYFEGFHRVHCLHLVMQYAFREDYDLTTQHFFNQDPKKVKGHVEHCLDNIRWGLDCTSDVTPYLVEQHLGADGITRMHLNLKKQAKCRDSSAMQKYAQEYSVGGLRPISYEIH